MTRPQRVGICTGGGDAPGLNAVIRGFVKAGRRAHGLELFGIADGLGGLIGPTPHIEPLDFAQVRGLLPMGGTILGTTNRGNPFRYPVRDPQTGVVTEQDIADEIVSNARRFGLDGVVMVGGDGLTANVKKETDAALNAHGLIKVRVFSDDRAAREAMFQTLAQELSAAPIQHIGKLLVLWRPMPEKEKAVDEDRKAGPRDFKVLKYSKRAGQRPEVKTLRVLGNQRLTPGGNVKRAKPKPKISLKKRSQAS